MIATGLETLQFDNRFTQLLPGDPQAENFRRQVRGACYSRVRPTPVAAPRLLAWSHDMAGRLGLDFDPFQTTEAAEIFGGNRLLKGMDPFAMCYGGHQFGNWAGQLGDGRAINLGEVLGRGGDRWMLQLKGAGPTPYSRTADGLAVLRSSVREFLCSEAMYHLGVPTTRALSLVATGEMVTRDMFYDGNPKREPGAVVCRVAPTFTRFGNFQILSSRKEHDLLQQLVDYTITNDFPHLGSPSAETRAEWFREVCVRTADMVVHWMRVGFVHGVMNTDNMSIAGLTIDYGPYGWLEDFDPSWTPNTTDASGRRYSFGQQPQIALWNLVQLANALFPVFGSADGLQAGVDAYTKHFNASCLAMMAAKTGLSHEHGDDAAELANELPDLLQEVETDMTIFYRALGSVELLPEQPELSGEQWSGVLSGLQDSWYQPELVPADHRVHLQEWLQRYRAMLQMQGLSDLSRQLRMNQVNPKYVLRNYLAQLAIDRAEQGDPGLIHELLQVLHNPFDEQPDKEHFSKKRPEWAKDRAGCSMLSCSS